MKARKRAMQPVIDYAEALGYTVTITGKHHLRFSKPGKCPVFTSSTPSCYRSTKNAIATLRRSNEGVL